MWLWRHGCGGAPTWSVVVWWELGLGTSGTGPTHIALFFFFFLFLPHPFHLITAWLCPHHCRCFCHAAMKLEAFCKLKKAPCRQKLACYSKILHWRNIFNTEAKQLQIYGGNEVITDTSTARMAKFSWRSALQIIYSNYLECYFHFKEPS